MRILGRVFIFLFFIVHSQAGINDYKFPYTGPSFSNYGTVGLLQNPTARFFAEGTLGVTWNRQQPYLRGSIMAYPFSWLEASYQYVDINNVLYSPVFEFSGNQTYKDKSFDFKLRLLEESLYLPQVAVGFRDAAGTGLFSSEYLVISKFYQNFDFTFGLGWGDLNARSYTNPLIKINDSFAIRELTGSAKGGEFSTNSFFSGDIGIFGGLEVYLPFLSGATLKVEYDGTNYETEGFSPPLQASKINYGINWPVTENTHLKLGYIRGNTINLGFSFSRSFASKKHFIPKNDPHIPVQKRELFKIANKQQDRYFYLTSLDELRKRELFLQSADIDYESKTAKVAFSQNTHISYIRAIGRVSQVLDEITPEDIKTFSLTNLNADMGMHTVKINRDRFRLGKKSHAPVIALESAEFTTADYAGESYAYKPKTSLPLFLYGISPDLRSQIGGPDGFYFGDLRLAINSETLFKKNVSLITKASVGVVNNMQELKLPSDSILPHVRTDIVQYLKESNDYSLDILQLNIYDNPATDLYTKFSMGIFEQMFGGVGGEILYRNFEKRWAIGLDAWFVKQRDFNQLLEFSKYQTMTGHLTFYLKEPITNVLVQIKAGKFLAKDSGFNFDFSRRFNSGLHIGAFFSLTDISKEEFGEGSFDKGFYFFIPVEQFFSNYQKGFSGYGLRPVTRDGAAILNHSHKLWGVTDQSNIYNLNNQWDDLYD